MDADSYQRMTLEECLRSMILTKPLQDAEENDIASIKKTWVEDFTNVLKYALDRSEDEKINSSDLADLWLFYTEGIRVRKLFEKFDQEQILNILKIENPLEHILSDGVCEMTNIGVFLYQVAYYLKIVKYKIEESLIRYKSVYNSDDPILWLKNNDNKFRLSIINQPFSENHDLLCNLWRKIYKVSNVALDPIFQK